MSDLRPLDPMDQDWAELSHPDDWNVRCVYQRDARRLLARELDRLVDSNREFRSITKGFLAAERAVHDYWVAKLERRAAELRGGVSGTGDQP